jgi:hypothetical protein
MQVSGLYLSGHSSVLENSSIRYTSSGHIYCVLVCKLQENSSVGGVLECAGVGYVLMRTFKSLVCARNKNT